VKRDKAVYWIFTLLFLLPAAGSGVPEALGAAPAAVAATMAHLGYPPYLARILGFAKVLGALAILAGRYRRAKEWAYAGFTFDFLGAAASHLFAGDKVEPLFPLIFLALMSVSYAYWHKLEDAAPAQIS